MTTTMILMKASTQQGIIDEKQKTTKINEFPPIEFHPMCVFWRCYDKVL